jgi:hypothetical protein
VGVESLCECNFWVGWLGSNGNHASGRIFYSLRKAKSPIVYFFLQNNHKLWGQNHAFFA